MDTNIKFEQDYLFRNYRTVTSVPDVALTEFIANAWDAGAYNVSLLVPYAKGDMISIEDDGTGMTDEEFRNRWMTLNYNRKKKQGDKVLFPDEDDKSIRKPYGRNGIGRHGMLCFADYYYVDTWKNGKCNRYKIEISFGETPYKIVEHSQFEKCGHGTKISTYLERNLPNLEELEEVLSVRFLYDPRFKVTINNKFIDLLQHSGIVVNENIQISDSINLDIIMIDSTKTAQKNQQHGIAFWVSGRLVGKPSWTYSGIQFVDGRLRFAKKYTIVIKSEDLSDYIQPDWSGFYDNTMTQVFFDNLRPHIDRLINLVMKDQLDSIRFDVINDVRDSVENLGVSSKRGISHFIEEITNENPIINPEFLKLAVETLANIEKAKNGQILLRQLSCMDANSLDKLSNILSNWDVDDIAYVLDEIDRRIVVIEALERLGDDKSVDELNTIHPLILNSRWLFGAEFDSPMFVSNKTLSTVIKCLFKDSDYDLSVIDNPKKRPDIVCLNKFTFKAVCTDRFDVHDKMMKPDQILVIEVKRGGFEITSDEMSQAQGYVRQIKKSAVLHSDANITAYVVGSKLGDIDSKLSADSGTIYAVTFDQLIETSKNKLFKLKEALSEHYQSISTETIVDRALNAPKQMDFLTRKK